MLDNPTLVAITKNGQSEEIARIVSVKEILRRDDFVIPVYQRPYKWTFHNVTQLIDDILLHRDRSAYRIGTLVLHHDKDNKLYIVDGQQRTITFALIAQALFMYKQEELGRLSSDIEVYKPVLVDQLKFRHPLSKQNIRDNYQTITRRVREFDEDAVRAFYYKCELVQVEIGDVSEAFQFFDSQNARGKDLEPHDLLKAFHLREMAEHATETERLKSVNGWESYNSENLTELFGEYLYRIRNWSKGRSARFFTKGEVELFKGINPEGEIGFPYTRLYRIGHYYTEEHSQSYHRKIDRNAQPYPFQLDQVVINGKRFFEQVDYYQKMVDVVKKPITSGFVSEKDFPRAFQILEVLDTYEARDRKGDKYVRNLFDCCLIYYVDKFGLSEIDRATEKFFIWAYSLRLSLVAVHISSIDNRALEPANPFKLIREALHPRDIFAKDLPQVSVSTRPASKMEKVKELFEKFGYDHE